MLKYKCELFCQMSKCQRFRTVLLIGVTGESGVPGGDGATGVTGMTGPRGRSGATGVTGPTGSKGASGATGFTGRPGLSVSTRR